MKTNLVAPKIMESEVMLEFGRFKTRRDVLELDNGHRHAHFTVEHPGAVIVVPRATPKSVLMVRQYRHSLGTFMLEFPAGTIDRIGDELEDPRVCAARELQEEVNMKADHWSLLGKLAPAPGFCSEIQYCFLADDLSACSGSDLDPDEILEVVEVEIADVPGLLSREEVMDGKTLALLWLLEHTHGGSLGE
jgi:ADP-ribose pyrophosphatase